VNYLGDFDRAFDRLRPRVAAEKQEGDIVIVSIHWGSNWGYEIPDSQRRFARRLIEEAAVDIVHGHSSHHARMIELHRGKPILYGCGDFLNDYEGISGEEEYRPDLVLAYRMVLDRGGRLSGLELLPFRIAKFRLQHATREEAQWLAATMDRECRLFGGRVALDGSVLRFSAGRNVH
jgi:poly-gamma-glutamate synthesis protein (capsule biosynthesis protein)